MASALKQLGLMAGQGHECVESALAKEKCRQEKLSGEWFTERPRHGERSR
jgi:hypothetical protein